MKLKYVGALRRDGSCPKINVNGEFVDVVDGVVNVVDADEAQALIDTKNFLPADAHGDVDDDLLELIEQAKALGIKANRNWGKAKLQAAIAEVKPPKQDEGNDPASNDQGNKDEE